MKVLVVDDSVIFRSGITMALESVEGLQVVGTAANGKIALEKIATLKPNVITLDIEMPELDGIETIKAIRKIDAKVAIIVFSDLSEAGASKTLEALSLGADDFLPKSIVKEAVDSVVAIRAELAPKVLQFRNRFFPANSKSVVQKTAIQGAHEKSFRKPDLIVIGSSTGGPEALRRIFGSLKEYKGPPILIVQHMPPIFTAQLAKLLGTLSGMSVREARDGDVISPNSCYIAPGDFHMAMSRLDGGYILRLNQGDRVQSVRPAADVLFKSVAENFSGQVLAIVLTGMGCDGLDGVRKLKELGSRVVIQDKESCVVYGMPGAIAEHRLQNDSMDLDQIANLIRTRM